MVVKQPALNIQKMKNEDTAYQGNDPGAVKFGNFINYYTFHSAKERIDHLHHQMFYQPTDGTSYVCLDIGCNSGELTQEVYKYLKAIYPHNEIFILGVDIDPILIKRAEEKNQNRNIIFQSLDITDSEQKIIRKYLSKNKKHIFDVTFCFSVIMWIHLNNGDDGLFQFLDKLTAISKAIILEQQPWHCYRNAQKRLKKAGGTFPMYRTLKIRSNVNDVIEAKITKTHKKVFESSLSTWKRKIVSFHCTTIQL